MATENSTTELAIRKASSDVVANMQAQWAKVLPSICTPDRFARIALSCVNKNPVLGEALMTPSGKTTVLAALMTCAELGIEPDGRRAHLIAFKKKSGGFDITLIIDYKGLAELVMRSGDVSNIHADVVRENDEFEYDRGMVKVHKIDFRKPRGEMYAAYCIIRMKDGSEKSVAMSKEEIYMVRAKSSSFKAFENGYVKTCVWTDEQCEPEMWKKGLAVDTLIPTPTGWTTMQGIEEGDEVFDMNGKITKVIAVSEVKNIPCYKITFSNGDSIVCDNEHRWVARIGSEGARQVWKTTDIGDMYSAKQSGKIVTVPVAAPLNTENKYLPIDPWLLGYWLGNGNKIHANITCHRDDSAEIVLHINSSKYQTGAIRFDSRSKAVSIGIKDGFLDDLRSIGVIGNKHVPSEYLRASAQQRLELLRGLMDSDGHIDKSRSRAMFGSTDKVLTDAVAELAVSLGEVVCRFATKAKGYGVTCDFYSVTWKPTIAPVGFYRKLKNFKPRKFNPYKGIKSIEKIPSVPTKCIAVDSSTKTYLAGKEMVPTHNTVFRNCSKWVPLSPEVRKAVEVSDKEEFIDTTAEVVGETCEGKTATKAKVDKLKAKIAASSPAPDEAPIDADIAGEEEGEESTERMLIRVIAETGAPVTLDNVVTYLREKKGMSVTVAINDLVDKKPVLDEVIRKNPAQIIKDTAEFVGG